VKVEVTAGKMLLKVIGATSREGFLVSCIACRVTVFQLSGAALCITSLLWCFRL